MPQRRPRQLPTLALLVPLVTALHLWLANAAGADRLGLGAAPTALPARMQVAFMRELAPRQPPPVVPAAVRAARRAPPRSVVPPAAAASQPVSGSASEPAAPLAESLTAAVQPPAAAAAAPDLADATPAAASAASLVVDGAAKASAETAASVPTRGVSATADSAVAALSSLPAAVESVTTQPPAPSTPAPTPSTPSATENFAWPPSTRLSYTLTGHYRGPVEGQAQVEWLLDGARYQVHMDLSIGPAFAPLASRRVSSEGLVTPQGLAPRRYDETTRALLRQPQQLTVWLDDDRVRLAHGRVEPRPPGVQDSASQFVHLTWLFTTQPERLRAGQSVTLPLALPRQLEPWVYDVLGAQTLATPAGDVETFHVKPRRAPRKGNDLTAEIWVAPSLQYLPVRILIRQDDSTYLDLLISRLPQQAAPGR